MKPQSPEHNRRSHDTETESSFWTRHFWLALVLFLLLGYSAGLSCFFLGDCATTWSLAWGVAIEFLALTYSTYRLDKALFEETEGEVLTEE